MIGQKLTHYRIDAKIGEGGMGVVYRATDTHLDRPVAIKILAAQAFDDDERKRRFTFEAKAASALNHPNIVTIHDIASADGIDFIVMEWVPGQTLAALIGQHGVPVAEVINLTTQIAGALAQAHAAGIVHRDLKPANIMVTAEGRVKILDFGLAKLAIDEEDDSTIPLDPAPLTRSGTIMGTIAYMSPEQAEGKKIDSRSDIFSFGSLLYEMLTGHRAFHAKSAVATLSAILHHQPEPLRQIVPSVPLAFERIVQQCLRKDPRQRFQRMDDICILLEWLRDDWNSQSSAATSPAIPIPPRRLPLMALIAILATAAIAAGLTWHFTRSSAPTATPGPVFTQVTFDTGLTTDPALSPDAKFLAYASDRAGDGNLDIWVRQIAGGQPIRLTRHSADDHDPTFSPDGSKILFRSERDPAGIYLLPALGGDERLIIPGGRRARFSPDGNWIAYAGGAEQAPHIFVVSASGGTPRRIETGTKGSTFPLWSPDGKRLLFINNSEGSPVLRLNWWVTPWEGGQATPTGAETFLHQYGLAGQLVGGPWLWSPKGVLFSAALGSSINLWNLPLSPDFRASAAPQPVTSGTATEIRASASGNTLAFAGIHQTVKLWSFPFDSAQGKPLGPPQHVTGGAADDGRPSISSDGHKLAFLSGWFGSSEVLLRDMLTGKEVALTSARGEHTHPRLTRDGSKLCYATTDGSKISIYVASAAPHPGVPEKICDDCGLPLDWSPDSRKILYWRGGPVRWFTIDVATRQTVEVMPRVDHDIHNVQYSPDGLWVSFNLPAEETVFVTRLQGAVSRGRSDWVRVGEGVHPWWSPDGKLLYFLSARDGFHCLWAQRLAPETRQPLGETFAVQHFHGARRTPTSATLGWGLAADRFVLPFTETTGNVWIAVSR